MNKELLARQEVAQELAPATQATQDQRFDLIINTARDIKVHAFDLSNELRVKVYHLIGEQTTPTDKPPESNEPSVGLQSWVDEVLQVQAKTLEILDDARMRIDTL